MGVVFHWSSLSLLVLACLYSCSRPAFLLASAYSFCCLILSVSLHLARVLSYTPQNTNKANSDSAC